MHLRGASCWLILVLAFRSTYYKARKAFMQGNTFYVVDMLVSIRNERTGVPRS